MEYKTKVVRASIPYPPPIIDATIMKYVSEGWKVILSNKDGLLGFDLVPPAKEEREDGIS